MRKVKRLAKLVIDREQLRLLTGDSMERVAGGYLKRTTTSDWCSSFPDNKCCSTTIQTV